MLGREVRLPAEVLFGSGAGIDGADVASYGQYVDVLRSRMQRAHEVAREHLRCRARRQPHDSDAKKPLREYSAGDLVWYLTEMGQMHTTPKLRVSYKGPVLILKKITALNYIIQLDESGTKHLVRHDKLKPYEGETVLSWAKKALAKCKKQSHHDHSPMIRGCQLLIGQGSGALEVRRVGLGIQPNEHVGNMSDVAVLPYRCSEDDTMVAIEEARRMLASRGRVLECQDCTFRGDRKQMENHRLDRHTMEDEVPFLCEGCGNRYHLKESFSCHLRSRTHKGKDRRALTGGTGSPWRLRRYWYHTLSEEESLAYYQKKRGRSKARKPTAEGPAKPDKVPVAQEENGSQESGLNQDLEAPPGGEVNQIQDPGRESQLEASKEPCLDLPLSDYLRDLDGNADQHSFLSDTPGSSPAGHTDHNNPLPLDHSTFEPLDLTVRTCPGTGSVPHSADSGIPDGGDGEGIPEGMPDVDGQPVEGQGAVRSIDGGVQSALGMVVRALEEARELWLVMSAPKENPTPCPHGQKILEGLQDLTGSVKTLSTAVTQQATAVGSLNHQVQQLAESVRSMEQPRADVARTHEGRNTPVRHQRHEWRYRTHQDFQRRWQVPGSPFVKRPRTGPHRN